MNPSRLAAAALLAGVLLAACGHAAYVPPSPTAAGSAAGCVTGSISAAGSTALQPLVDAAGKAYVASCAGATINVQGGGSGAGLTQVVQGAVQIGDSDVDAASKLQPADAAMLVDHVIARQGWLMVLNPDVTGVTNLTRQQASDIWTGKITSCKDVGGPDQPIVLIIRPQSSGTRAVWRQIVLQGQDEATGQALTEDSNGAVATAVEQTPYSTSVIGLAYFASQQGKLQGVSLDGVSCTVANIQNATYLVQGLGHLYTKGDATGLAAAFLTYLKTPAVQTGLIPSLSYASAP
jgi:phosphate transport system substrate-binding protein